MEVAGEVAEAWGHWLWNAEPLPRHAELLDQRFASNEQNYEALTNLRFEKDGYGNLMVHPMVLMAVGIFMGGRQDRPLATSSRHALGSAARKLVETGRTPCQKRNRVGIVFSTKGGLRL